MSENTRAVKNVDWVHKDSSAHPLPRPDNANIVPFPRTAPPQGPESTESPTQILQRMIEPRTQHTDLLLTEEMARAQSWSMWVMAMCLVAIGFVPFLPASPTGQWVLGCTMACLACTAFWTWRAAGWRSAECASR